MCASRGGRPSGRYLAVVVPLQSMPSETPTLTYSLAINVRPEHLLRTSTSTPSPAPTDTPTNEAVTDTSTIGTLALFAGVLGVIIGWALRELTAFVKSRAETKRQREADERARVLEFIHTGEVLSASANGIAMAYAATAGGRAPDSSQVSEFVTRYNEAQTQLDRLRLEIAILGPVWVDDLAMHVENSSFAVQRALDVANKRQSQPAFAALGAEIQKFQNERTKLIKAATKQYRPGRADDGTPQVGQTSSPQQGH